jgi:hypothetical protein
MPHLCGMSVKVGNAIFYRALHLYEMPVHHSPFTIHHKSLIFDKSGCTKPYCVKYKIEKITACEVISKE